MLSDTQIERYSRQIILPQVGGKGQEKLLRARILVNGSGPLQSSTLLYLAAAGVGTLGVVGIPSASPFAALIAGSGETPFTGLTQLNPDCTLVIHARAELENSRTLVRQYDLVLSAPDSLHEACYLEHRPFLCADINSEQPWLFSWYGYEPHQPCLQCVLAHVRTTAEKTDEPLTPEMQILAAMFLGTLQATEAMKLTLSLRSPQNKLFRCRFPALDFHESVVEKNSTCTWCGSSR